jgi:isoquinoline 1-oxidoreductase subunit beta
MTKLDTSRRRFLVGSAAAVGGLSIGFHVPGGSAVAQTAGTPEINAWVVVKPDDTVVIRIARIDMGQGTVTGLAQLVAEELECDWSKVTTEYPTPGQNLARNRVWGNFQTAGSQGIRQSQDYVRKGGAAARMMLVEAAARQWNVPAAECSAAKSVITHAASGRSTTYGKVADAAARLEAPKEIPLKDPKAWTIAGKPMKRLDTADKIDGRKVFGIDLVLPGMLNAAIKACPVFGGKLKGFDAASVVGKPGVRKVVAVGDNAVAVIADSWWQAKTALDAVKIDWDDGPNAGMSSEKTAAMLREGLDAKEAFVGNQAGDADAAIAAAARRVEAVYSVPHQHHVTMEPMNATARWTGGSIASRSGARPRTARARWPPRPRHPACSRSNARSTASISAAASAGAPPATTMSVMPS